MKNCEKCGAVTAELVTLLENYGMTRTNICIDCASKKYGGAKLTLHAITLKTSSV